MNILKFYLTFGQQSPFRNGWVEIETASYDGAKKLAFSVFGNHWSGLYTEEVFPAEFFPSGKLGETLR